MKWFKIYGERWFMGSTRWELTVEQRAVWIDLLAKASINDPPGQIDYFSLEQLAHQFYIDLELLKSTIKRCEEEKKVNHFPKKRKILIINWKKYQSEYERQKVYRQQDRNKLKVTKADDKSCNKVTLRGEGEEKRIEAEEKDIRGEEETFPSHPRNQFLFILREFSKEYPYPFDEKLDGQVYDLAVQSYRNVDHVRETEKKIDYWKENPGALKSTGKGPRQQLNDFFKKEAEYQNGDSKKYHLNNGENNE